MAQRTAPHGMRIFTFIWIGQLFSLIGSGLTEFALGVWVYQRTESATQFALITFFIALPHIVISPLAGALVDRWDRRWAMILSDVGAGCCTLIVALLLFTGRLEIWHVYVAVLASSTFGAFQFPAYSVVMTMLVPKEHLGRANGMVELAWAAGRIISPLLAGLLVAAISIEAVILIDVATFLFALGALLVVRVPNPEPTSGDAEEEGILRSVRYGWAYIAERPGLRGLLLFFLAVNFSLGFFQALFVPLILSFASTETLGITLSVGSSGLLIGGLLMSVWGGPRRRIHGVIGLGVPFGLCLLLTGVQPSVTLIAVASFVFFLLQPIINACDHAIWQSKVEPDVQGRVFAMRRTIEMSSALLAYLIAGPVIDYLFAPLLAADGPLVGSVGQLIGVGPGRGIGLLFVLLGLMPIGTALWAYLSPRVRLVEDELPDVVADKPADEEQISREADDRVGPVLAAS